MNTDPRETILKSPMSTMQIVVVIITIALNALDGFDVLSISLAVPAIRDEFGASPAVTGLLLSMELVGMALGSIFLGKYADVWGRRPMMLFCLVLMTAGMFTVTTQPGFLSQGLKSVTDSMGLLQDWPIELIHISIWRVITGLGIGGMLASINAVVSEYSNAKNKHLNVALMSIGYPVGAATGGFIAAAMLAEYSWRSVFYLGFAMTVVMIPLVYFLVPETVAWNVRNQKPGTLERVNASLKRMGHAAVSALPDVSAELKRQQDSNIFTPKFLRTTIIVTAAYFFHIMTFYFILKWTGVILVDRGFDQTQAGQVLSWVNVGGATGGALLGLLTLKYDLKKLTIGAMLLSTVSVLVYGWNEVPIGQMAVICLTCGFFINAAINGMYAIFAHAYPTRLRAAGTGFAIGVGRGGSLLAPITAGFLFEGGMGVAGVTTIMAAGSLLAAVALSFLQINTAPPDAVGTSDANEDPDASRLAAAAS